MSEPAAPCPSLHPVTPRVAGAGSGVGDGFVVLPDLVRPDSGWTTSRSPDGSLVASWMTGPDPSGSGYRRARVRVHRTETGLEVSFALRCDPGTPSLGLALLRVPQGSEIVADVPQGWASGCLVVAGRGSSGVRLGCDLASVHFSVLHGGPGASSTLHLLWTPPAAEDSAPATAAAWGRVVLAPMRAVQAA